jgi:hypothetical protein
MEHLPIRARSKFRISEFGPTFLSPAAGSPRHLCARRSGSRRDRSRARRHRCGPPTPHLCCSARRDRRGHGRWRVRQDPSVRAGIDVVVPAAHSRAPRPRFCAMESLGRASPPPTALHRSSPKDRPRRPGDAALFPSGRRCRCGLTNERARVLIAFSLCAVMTRPATGDHQPPPNSGARPQERSRPRRKNRFNERELARAGRVGKAVGAERIEVDPATGKISIILPSKGATAHGPDDLLSKL